MSEGIFTILGVILGFYLARYSEVNKKISEKIQCLREQEEKKYGEPFIVKTDEADLEREQEVENKKKDKIFLKDILK